MSGGRVETGRIEGVVVDDAKTPFYQEEMEVKGQRRDFVVRDSFAIQGADGVIQVEVDTQTVLLPEREVAGDFGDLLDDPLTELLMDHAPGDHVHTKITGNLVRGGDALTILGDLHYGNNHDGGYREAPSQSVVRVRATAVALGDDGGTLIDAWIDTEREIERSRRQKDETSKGKAKPKKKKPSKDPLAPAKRPLLLLWIFTLITVGLLGFGFAQGLPTFYENKYEFFGANVVWLLGTSCLGLTAFIWRRRRWMPSFHSVGKGGSGKGERWSVGLQVMMASVLFFIPVMGLAMMPTLSCYVAAALCLYFPFMIVWADQKSANKALTLLRTKALSPDLPDKRFGRIEGRFEGQIDLKRKHETHSSSRSVTRTDANGNSFQATETTTWVTWTERCKSEDGASLLLEADTAVDLQLRNAEWAASEYQIRYPKKGSGGQASFYKHMPKGYARRMAKAVRRGKPVLEFTAHHGDSMLAAARVRRTDDGTVVFQASGPGSFLLFTAPEGESAVAALRVHLLGHYLGLALALSSVGLPLYFVLSW